MKTQSIALTIFSGLIAFGLLMFLIQIWSKKMRNIADKEMGSKLSFTFFFGGILISGSLLLAKALPLIPEGFKIQWELYHESFVFSALQLIATIIGFCFLWLAVIYTIVDVFASILLGKRDAIIEMERDNYSYFLSKGIALVCLSLIAASFLEFFLRVFMPTIDVPFYH